MKKNVSLILFSLIILIGSSFLSACSGSTASSNSPLNFEKGKVEAGDLSAHIVANGIVHPTRSLELPWKISGQVETIEVKPLQTVTNGQKLAKLSDASLPTNMMSARLDLLEAQKALKGLQDNKTAIEQARVTLVNAKDELDKATLRYNAVAGPNRYVTDAYIDGVRAELMMAESEVEKAQNAYDHVAGRGDDDPEKAYALKYLSEMKTRRDKALANLNYVTGKPSAKEIEKATADRDLAQAKVEEAQRAYDRIKNGPPAEDLSAAQTRVSIAQATLDQAVLTAPFAGLVTTVASRTNDVVQPGQIALSIEDQTHMYVDAQVSEVDVNRIRVDQAVEMTFDAVYGKTYHGKIVEIGNSGVSNQGVVNFPVRVELTDRDASIRSGMTAMVRIQIAEVKGATLIPNSAVRMVDGQQVVFIEKGQPVPTQVPVKLGISSDTQSQVLEGDVKAGDVIILNPDLLLAGNGAVGR